MNRSGRLSPSPPLHILLEHRHIPRLLGRPGGIAGDPHSAAGLSRSEVLNDDDDTRPTLPGLAPFPPPPLLSLLLDGWIPIQMLEPTRSQTGGGKKKLKRDADTTQPKPPPPPPISTAQGPGSLMGGFRDASNTYLPCAWSTSYTRYMRLPRDPSHSLPDLKPSSERTYSHPSAHPPPPCWRRSAYSPRGRRRGRRYL